MKILVVHGRTSTWLEVESPVFTDAGFLDAL